MEFLRIRKDRDRCRSFLCLLQGLQPKTRLIACAISWVALLSWQLTCPEEGRSEMMAANIPGAIEGIDVLGVVKKTMERQAAIRIQREQVNLTRGAYRSSGGDFDWRAETYFVHRQNNAPIPSADPAIATQESADFGVRFSKLFRSGVSVEPVFQYTESEYRLLHNQTLGPPTKTGSVGLLFKLPLLRGLGYANTAVGEIAAAHELKAAQLTLSHEISRSVYEAVQAFWAYLAAYERFAVLAEAEERARTILNKTERLVQGEELPAAELINVRANLADKEGARFTAMQAVITAQSGLGTAMGISAEDISKLPVPSGSFPDLDRGVLMQTIGGDGNWYARTAGNNRLDLLAMSRQNEALNARLQAARNGAKPELNLELSLGYDGIESGSSLRRTWQTTSYRQDTPDWSTGFRLHYPLGNNSAQGNLEQALARYRQAVLREEELTRSIQTDIALVRSSLLNALNEIERSDDAVRNYTTAVANEREKYLLGETTLLDLLDIEDRRDGAMLNRIALRQRLANNLARLRFATGTLIRFAEEEGIVTHADLTTVLLPEDTRQP